MCGCLSMWGCVCLRLRLTCVCYICRSAGAVVHLSVVLVSNVCTCKFVLETNCGSLFFEVVACGCPSLPRHNGTEAQLCFLLRCSAECSMLKYTMWTTVWLKSCPVCCSEWEVRLAWISFGLFCFVHSLIMCFQLSNLSCLNRGQSLFLQKV